MEISAASNSPPTTPLADSPPILRVKQREVITHVEAVDCRRRELSLCPPGVSGEPRARAADRARNRIKKLNDVDVAVAKGNKDGLFREVPGPKLHSVHK